MKRSLLLLLTLGLTAPAALAQAPEAISYQGNLTDTQGSPVTGMRDITVKLYTAASQGNLVWSGLYNNVSVTQGVFSVVLAGGTPQLNYVAFDRPLYVEVTVANEDGSSPQVLSPRTPLTSSPYALSVRGLRVIEYPYEYLGSEPGAKNMIGGSDANRLEGSTTVGATIAGGGSFETDEENVVSGMYGSIGGGFGNRAAGAAVVGGGAFNSALGASSAVGGGNRNLANGAWAVVGGGEYNRASGSYAVVPGGEDNQARGTHSLAAGYKARAKHNGTFVWSDRSLTNDSLVSTTSNQFLIRASGGVGIGTNAPTNALSVVGQVDVSSRLMVGGTGPFGKLLVSGADGSGNGVKITASVGDEASLYFLSQGLVFDNYRVSDGRRQPILLQPNGGRVGIGTTAPAEALDVNGNTRIQGTLSTGPTYPRADNSYSLGWSGQRWTSVWAINGTVQTSDARLKTDIKNLGYGLAEVMRMRPVSFRWRGDRSGRTELGLIAQEVNGVIPELVEGSVETSLGMNYAELVPVLVRAIQELQAEIEALKGAGHCAERNASE